MSGGSGRRGCFQQVQRLSDDPALHVTVKRLTARAAQWEVNEDEPRYAAMLDDVAGRSNDNGWDAVFFQMTCDQTHGLVADGSDRCQDGDVGAFLSALRQGCRG